MDVCFWCNRSKDNESEGSPEYFDYEPCGECSKWWSKGVLVVQVTDLSNGNPPIIEGLFPTGMWAVISEGSVKKVLTDYVGIDSIMKSKTMYVNVDDWDKVINPNIKGFVKL